MNDYKEFQFGWIILGGIISAELLVTFLYAYQIGDKPMPLMAFVVFTIATSVTCLLFYGLQTTVTDREIIVSFGIGLIRKRIELKRISSVDTVENTWLQGWGIRIIRNGMLYNISGFKAVELTFNDSTRVFRIGSQDSASLKKEILQRLK